MATYAGLELNRRRAERASGGRIAGGTVSGLIAGCAMLVFASCASAAAGYGGLTPLRLISCSVYGVNGLVVGPAAPWTGLAIHLAISACWGMLFASILPERSTPWTSIWTGVLYGICVWAVMTFAVLPWADAPLRARADLLPEWHFYSHLVFGAALLGTPWLRRRTASSVGVGYVRRWSPRPRIPV